MEVPFRSRFGDPRYLGKPDDVHGWLSGLHRVSVRRLRVSEISSADYVFSISESEIRSYRIKAVLYALVRRFEFSLAVPAEDVTWSNIPATRKAYIKGREDKGPHMPLRVKPYVEA